MTTWLDVLALSFQTMWANLLSFLPEFLIALIVFIIGLIVAVSLGKLAAKIIYWIRLDDLVKSTGLVEKCEALGLRFTLSSIVGWIVKWFFVVVVLLAVTNFLGWAQVTDFLSEVAMYLPNVLIAVVILTVGLVMGQFAHNVVEKAIKVSQTPTMAYKPLAALSKWSIIIFALLAALVQLGIATALIQILFTGLIAMLAIAGGLAFGLGGKEKASKWLDAIEKEVSKKE